MVRALEILKTRFDGNKVTEAIIKESKSFEKDFEGRNVNQLDKGLRSNETSMPNYAASNIKTGPITLEETGSFHNSITAKVMQQGIGFTGEKIVSSGLNIVPKFVKEYTENIFGTTREWTLDLLRNKIIPNAIKNINL